MDVTTACMQAYTSVPTETETVSSDTHLLEVTLSGIIQCEKQLIHVVLDSANVLQYAKMLHLLFTKPSTESGSQCNHKVTYLVQCTWSKPGASSPSSYTKKGFS